MDLSFDQVRVDVSVGASVRNGAVVKARFSPTGSAPWTRLCDITLGTGTNQTYYGGYVDLPRDAMGQQIFIDIAGLNGNGAANTTIEEIVVRFVRNGDLAKPADRSWSLPVSAAEKTAATSTALRQFSPKDVRDILVLNAPYDLLCGIVGLPANGEMVLLFVAPRAFRIPANAAGSRLKAGTAATGSSVFSIQKNGVQFLTVTVAASGTTATFASSQTDFAAGDVLRIVAPAIADASLADIAITLAAILI